MLIRPTSRKLDSGFSNKRASNKGFTLIEVLVTIVVVSIGLLGLAGLQISGLRANVSSEARSKATLLASDIIERMRANPLGVAANNYSALAVSKLANGNCSVPTPARICSNTNTTAAVNCTASQMATFDEWVWGCGLTPAAGAQRGGVINLLPNGSASVTCNDNGTVPGDPCSPGSTHTVTISWDENSPNATTGTTAGTNTTQSITLVVVP